MADRGARPARCAPTQAAARHQDVLDGAQVAVEVGEPALDDRDDGLVAQQALVHAAGASVEGVQLA